MGLRVTVQIDDLVTEAIDPRLADRLAEAGVRVTIARSAVYPPAS